MTISKRNMPYPLNLLNSTPLGRFEDDTPLEFETPLNDDQLKGLEFALSFLTDREQKVLKMYFEEYKTLKDIGQIIGVGPERIRQLKAKGLRKLRHPLRFNYILYGYSVWSKAEEERKNRGVRGIPLRPTDKIAELDLPVRAYNCLKRAGYDTPEKIVEAWEMGPDGPLTHIRNFGVKSMKEVLDSLVSHGYLTLVER